VRVKVAALRSAQVQPTGATHAAQHYLDLALACSHAPAPALMITHGPSGSGKTTLTQGLLESAGAIRIRADVERKRLFGLDAMARSGASLNAGLYSGDASAATYARLLELAVPVLDGGCHVVLDATFLRRAQRDAACGLATARGLRFVILDFDLDAATLRERVSARAARGDDASDAGLDALTEQLRNCEPLAVDEQPFAVRCGPMRDDATGRHRADWSSLLETLAASG
jgi:predicted kinase